MAKRTASARKQARATVGRTLRNRSVRSAVKTRVVRVRKAITEHAEGVVELGVAAISSLDRAAGKGILHPNNAARRKSRLMQRLNKQAAFYAANPNALVGAATTRTRNARPARPPRPAARPPRAR